jgi:hypothetical protein
MLDHQEGYQPNKGSTITIAVLGDGNTGEHLRVFNPFSPLFKRLMQGAREVCLANVMLKKFASGRVFDATTTKSSTLQKNSARNWTHRRNDACKLTATAQYTNCDGMPTGFREPLVAQLPRDHPTEDDQGTCQKTHDNNKHVDQKSSLPFNLQPFGAGADDETVPKAATVVQQPATVVN